MLKKFLIATIASVTSYTGLAFAHGDHHHHESQEDLRIVSASNPLTQIVAALNRENLFVGLDKTSHTKPEYANIPDVGYRIQLSTEGILSLKPNLILLANDSGPVSTIEQLQQSNVEIIQFEPLKDVASIQTAVSTISDKLHLTKEGKALNQQIETEANELKALSAKNPKLTGFFVMQGGSGQGSPQISGSDTTAAQVLELLNIDNLFAQDFANYKAVSIENQMQKRPDIVLLGHTGQFDPKNNGNPTDATKPPFQLRKEGMAQWPQALQPKCVFDVDMSHYLVFGVHIYDNNIKLLKAIQQCLAE